MVVLDGLLDRRLVGLLAGRGVLASEGRDPPRHSHGGVRARAAVVDAARACAELEAGKPVALRGEFQRLQDLEDAPGAGQRPAVLVKHHHRAPALGAAEGQIEGRGLHLPAQLLANLMLVVAEGANPVAHLGAVRQILRIRVLADRRDKLLEGGAPEVGDKPLQLSRTRKLGVGQLARLGKRADHVCHDVVHRPLAQERVEGILEGDELLQGYAPRGPTWDAFGRRVLCF
mmetsp:Transcript_2552/g.8560  ORF Transcript_2552/g.8560 Transcript_2552/m.8560 type:complete len:230 (+) Transcript_2552:496-1185(+)